jgi:hypothetical protein
MGIYRNEELLVGNHIAIPEYKDFTGRIIGTDEIKKVQISGSSGFNEVETIRGTYYLRAFSDFSSFKDACGE